MKISKVKKTIIIVLFQKNITTFVWREGLTT